MYVPSKLTPRQCIAVRARAKSGTKHHVIAADYGVSRALVTRVVNGDVGPVVERVECVYAGRYPTFPALSGEGETEDVPLGRWA